MLHGHILLRRSLRSPNVALLTPQPFLARRHRLIAFSSQDWLLPKFQDYCDKMGWDMPPVGALEVDKPAQAVASSFSDVVDQVVEGGDDDEDDIFDEPDGYVVSHDGGRSYSDLTDDFTSGESSGSLSGGKKERSSSVLHRAVHKISKRARQRKERKRERERAQVWKEAEERASDAKVSKGDERESERTANKLLNFNPNKKPLAAGPYQAAAAGEVQRLDGEEAERPFAYPL